MDDQTRRILNHIGRNCGTPAYVYFPDRMRARAQQLRIAFDGRFRISYAVKSNPNLALLSALRDTVDYLDVSSAGEIDRGLDAGYAAERLSFSGPAKRVFELERALAADCGELVCESVWELAELDRLAAAQGRRVRILVRINPARVPRKFGLNMAGKPSQFGIDEEDADAVLAQLPQWRHLEFAGFHVYSGSNSLEEEAIAENFGIFIELFHRFAGRHALRPQRLVFGSGFGIPYFPDDRTLNLQRLAGLVNPQIDAMRQDTNLATAECVLEMGRWLVGGDGYLVTGVINAKRSRGVEIRMCDAGFNNHLNACGMMGTVIRRNWRIWNTEDADQRPLGRYQLVGPLCTTFDLLAQNIELPEPRNGDVLAIGASGAYGLSASPTRFISHPEPREYMVRGDDVAQAQIEDASETPAVATRSARGRQR